MHALFAEDPRFQLDARTRHAGLILDEAQRLPALFDALRGAIDADRQRMGRFVIPGSAQPALVRHVSESLAGRVGILEFSPLTAPPSSTKGRAWIRSPAESPAGIFTQAVSWLPGNQTANSR